jgi:hypothetical protein
VNNRITLCLRVGALAIIAWMFVSGRPPAGAQHPGQVLSTEHVVTRTDEDQDLAISKLQEFRANQEAWNKLTGDEVALSSQRTNQFWGGIVVIGALITGSVGLQFRRKPV